MKNNKINVKNLKIKVQQVEEGSSWKAPSKDSIIHSIDYDSDIFQLKSAEGEEKKNNNLNISEDLLAISEKVFFVNGVYIDESEIKSINICVEESRTYVSYTLLGRVTKPREELFKSLEELFEWQRSKFASKFSSGTDKVSYVKEIPEIFEDEDQYEFGEDDEDEILTCTKCLEGLPKRLLMDRSTCICGGLFE